MSTLNLTLQNLGSIYSIEENNNQFNIDRGSLLQKGIIHMAKNHRIATKIGKPVHKTLLFCPCCANPINNNQISICCELSETYHLGIAYHLYFHYIKASIIILCTLALATIYITLEKTDEWYLPLMNIITIRIMITYFQSYEILSKENFSCISNFSIFVKKLKNFKDSKEIMQFFEEASAKCSTKIASICFVYDINKMKALKSENNGNKLSFNPNNPSNDCFLRLAKQVSIFSNTTDEFPPYFQDKLSQSSEIKSSQNPGAQLSQSFEEKFHPIHAYVTFESTKDLKIFLNYESCLPKTSKPYSLVKSACEPEEIIWENLTKIEVYKDILNRIVSYAVVIFGGLSSCIFIIWCTIFNNYNAILVSVIVFIYTYLLTLVIVNLSERQLHKSISNKINRSVKRITLFGLVYKIGVGTYFFFKVLFFMPVIDQQVVTEYKSIMQHGLDVMYNYFILNLVLPSLLAHMSGTRIKRILLRTMYEWNPQKFNCNQIQLNQLYEYLPFDFNQRLGWVNKIFLLVIYFTFFNYWLGVLGILSLLMIYWIDKLVLLKYSRKSTKLSYKCISSIKFSLYTSIFMVIMGYYFWKVYTNLDELITSAESRTQYLVEMGYLTIAIIISFAIYEILINRWICKFFIKIMKEIKFLRYFNGDISMMQYNQLNPANQFMYN